MKVGDKKFVYSPFKAAHWPDKIEQLKRGELILPVSVQWDLTNRCNMDCTFCFYHIHDLGDFKFEDTFDAKLALKVMDELKDLGVKAIEWTGGGEPTLHPYFKLLIHYAKKKGFRQALVTNGTNLDEFALRTIKSFDWVRFSVDAATPETWAKVKRRDPKIFSTVIENIRKLNEMKEEHCIVGFSFIVCRENYKEIYEAGKLAYELGCDNVRYSLAMTPQKEKLFEGIWEECLEQLEKAKELETKEFKVFAFSNRINELSLKVLSDYCGYHHFVAVIGANGCIYPCCRLKYYSQYNFGSLYEKSFKEIWFGEKRREFIESIKNGCPYDCWMTEKNKFIEYLIKDNPPHIEYV